MKKKVAIVIIMVITIVLITIIGLFVLNRNKDENSKNDFENVDSNQSVNETNSNEKTGELSYSYKSSAISFNFSVTVPKDSNYKLTEEKPICKVPIMGNFYLAGGKIIGVVSFKGYFNSPLEVLDYNGMVNKIKTDENFDALKPQEVKIAGRDALMTEVLEEGKLYGYLYNVNIDDIDPSKYLLLKLVIADGDSSNTENIFSDEEVQNIINSIVISK